MRKLLFLVPFYLMGITLTVEDDFKTIKNCFYVSYAMHDLKKEKFGWEINDQVARIESELSKIQSVRQGQKVIRKFIRSTRDYHCSILFASTEYSELPFRVSEASGRYFINWVDKDITSALKVGDELIEFGGRPIAKVVDDIIEQEGYQGSHLTDRYLALAHLTKRSGSMGFDIDQGTVVLTVKPKGSNKLTHVKTQWLYGPEIIHDMVKGFKSIPKKKDSSELTKKLQRKTLEVPFSVYFEGGEPHSLGARNSFLPYLGKMLWETDDDNFFHAYTFIGPNKKVYGYIRIPTYSVSENEVRELEKIIVKMQTDTSALVIDQMNNGGGSAFFLYNVLSYIVKQPTAIPKHFCTLTQEDVFESLLDISILESLQSDQEARDLLGDAFGGYPIDLKFAKSLQKYLMEQLLTWSNGKTTTDAIALFGVDTVYPRNNGYKKPILVLTNPLDFSCADFLPAILKDSKRATLLGQKTAGAGGAVTTEKFKNRSGILSYSFTCTKAIRQNGEYIENNGIQPDIEVALTPEDFQNNYNHYVGEIHKALISLIK